MTQYSCFVSSFFISSPTITLACSEIDVDQSHDAHPCFVLASWTKGLVWLAIISLVPWLQTFGSHTSVFFSVICLICTSSMHCSNLHLSNLAPKNGTYMDSHWDNSWNFGNGHLVSCFPTNENWINWWQTSKSTFMCDNPKCTSKSSLF